MRSGPERPLDEMKMKRYAEGRLESDLINVVRGNVNIGQQQEKVAKPRKLPRQAPYCHCDV